MRNAKSSYERTAHRDHEHREEVRRPKLEEAQLIAQVVQERVREDAGVEVVDEHQPVVVRSEAYHHRAVAIRYGCAILPT